MAKVGRPTLDADESERVRAAIVDLLRSPRFGGNQAALGRALGGLSGQAIGALVNGGNRPSLDTAKRVALLIGMPWPVLVGGEAVVVRSVRENDLAPREAVRRRALYTTSSPLVRAHFDTTPALEPSAKSRDELIAMYEEYIAQLRGQERAGFLGPVGAGLHPDDEIEEVDDPDDAG